MIHSITTFLTDEELEQFHNFFKSKHYVFLIELFKDKIKKGDIKINGEILNVIQN